MKKPIISLADIHALSHFYAASRKEIFINQQLDKGQQNGTIYLLNREYELSYLHKFSELSKKHGFNLDELIK